MEFNAIGKNKPAVKTTAKKDAPINLAVRLEKIEISADKASFFHGFRIDTGEAVSVRMMSVEEGALVNKRATETTEEVLARMKKQYVGVGESHRPRASEIADPKHKTHCQPGGLMMFTKAVKNDAGSYRAHWVETMEKEAGAGCVQEMANVRIVTQKDPLDEKKTLSKVVAQIVRPNDAVVLKQNNLMESLNSAFDPLNAAGEKRKPFVFVRLIDAQNGKVMVPPIVASAKYFPVERKDFDTGEEFTNFYASPAAESIANLMNEENTGEAATMIRSALFGLAQKEGYPVFPDTIDDDVKTDMMMITDNARSGAMTIEMIPGENINAGPAATASIMKAVETQPHNPMNTIFTVRNDNGRVTELRFTPTYLTTLMGKDGHRLFTKHVVADLYPQAKAMQQLATVNDHATAAKEAKARSAEANATHIEVPDGLPFDPSALDGASHDDVNAKLQASSEALEAGM